MGPKSTALDLAPKLCKNPAGSFQRVAFFNQPIQIVPVVQNRIGQRPERPKCPQGREKVHLPTLLLGEKKEFLGSGRLKMPEFVRIPGNVIQINSQANREIGHRIYIPSKLGPSENFG